MLARFSTALFLAAFLATPFLTAGCETHHEESTKQGLFGGTTHQESTTTRNPITGDVSTDSSKSTSR